MAYYRTSVPEDADVLAPKMRKQDALEVWHSHNMTPLEALRFSYDSSIESNTIISDSGEVIGMFGVGEISTNIGVPWLLASDALSKVARQFLPESEKWVERINERYDLLYNYVYAENKLSIRWLKWLGFSFIREIPQHGHNPAPFIEFAKHKGF
jgi:hypothetical protein